MHNSDLGPWTIALALCFLSHDCPATLSLFAHSAAMPTPSPIGKLMIILNPVPYSLTLTHTLIWVLLGLPTLLHFFISLGMVIASL